MVYYRSKQGAWLCFYMTDFQHLGRVGIENTLVMGLMILRENLMTAKLIVWTYDPETKQVQMMQSGYTKEVCAQLGVPLLIKNIPESLLPYIEPEDREKFSNAYKAMDQGSAYAEAEFRFKNPLQTSIQYERMVLKRIVNKASGKSFVYCCGQNITSFKAS